VTAVIGAGNVGCALAADLALRGREVRLFNRSAERLDPIRTAGGLTVTGELDGFAAVNVVTDSIDEAVDGAEVVVVALPTAALPFYARDLAAATSDEQVIWLNPGHSGGGLYLRAQFAAFGGSKRCLCQGTTASHVSRLLEPGLVHVFLRPKMALAALPAAAVDDCCERLDSLLPGQFRTAETILEVDLANINAVMHPPGMLCNAGWIEATEGDFGFYADGSRRAGAAVIDAIDSERLALAESLGVRALPFPQLLYELGFSSDPRATGAYEALHSSALIHPIKAPPTLDHRYLHEDVGWGLVPWLHLAEAVGCPVPTIAALIQLATRINGIDYAAEGLTAERMGLANATRNQIIDRVTHV